MTARSTEAIIQFGQVDAHRFSPDCENGDWQYWDVTFSEAFPDPAKIRVILTPNNRGVDSGTHNAAVVGIAQDVRSDRFRLLARNSDCAGGNAGFNWMAIAETPTIEHDELPDIWMGILQPQHFQPDCQPGDWREWAVTPGDPIVGADFPVVATASNLNITPFYGNAGLAYHNAAAVGIVRIPSPGQFDLVARNSDCAEGDCTFYYLATSLLGRWEQIWIDTGEVSAKSFAPDCHAGDWQSWLVSFSHSFMTPPMVFVTAHAPAVRVDHREHVEHHVPAPVGIAQNVTTHGFTLAARNSDCVGGWAGFYWVAIGCDLGCSLA